MRVVVSMDPGFTGGAIVVVDVDTGAVLHFWCWGPCTTEIGVVYVSRYMTACAAMFPDAEFVAERPYVRQIARRIHVPKKDQVSGATDVENEARHIARKLREDGKFNVPVTETKTAINLGICIGVGIGHYPSRWTLLTASESRKAAGAVRRGDEGVKEASLRLSISRMGECAARARIEKYADDHLADAYVQALGYAKLRNRRRDRFAQFTE